jgi:phosphate transport system substrate-binding protein
MNLGSRRVVSATGALIALAAALTALAAQEPQSVEESLELRRGHFDRIKARGAKQYYTRTFDLSGLPEYKPEPVSGTLRLCGSDYFVWVGNLSRYWEEGLKKYQPGLKIEYVKSNETVAPLVYGLADLGAGPRPVDWGERQHFQDALGYGPLEVQFATGSFNVPGWTPAISIFVHKDNPITKLTVGQLDGIFGAERRGGWDGTRWRADRARGPEKNIRTWGQLGLTGAWKDRPIHAYGRPLVYGLARQMERKVLKGGSMWNESLREYAHDVGPGGTTSLSAIAMLDDLGNDPYGIAYNNVDAGRAAPVTVKLVAVAPTDAAPAVEPTLETVQSRAYPLFLEMYFHMKREPGKPLDPRLREYIRYALSRQGQEAVQRDGKWLPLTAEVVRAELSKLE